MAKFVVRQDRVFIGVVIGLTIAGLPFLSKSFREREAQVHRMRERSIDHALEVKHATIPKTK